MIARTLWKLIALALLFCTLSAQAAVDARINRNPIREGETVELTIAADNGSDAPDFSPLNADFEILGTNQSHTMSIINGATSNKLEWRVTLSPKQSGRLSIPAITVGNETTAPITLVVLAAQDSSGAADSGNKDVFIEYSADHDHVYVQQQLVVTVKLYYRVQLIQPSLSEPKLDKTIIEKLGEDVQYETTYHGEPYQVVERKYAIYPQSSGRLTIPGVEFNGIVGGDSFFGGGQRLRVRAPKLNIEAQTPPAQFNGQWWLPAKQLTLKEEWNPDPSSLKVGEPITRTITIQANSLTGAQLPALPPLRLPNAKLYPDQAQTHNTPSANGIESERIEKTAIVPSQSGKLELPEIAIPWWNTETNQQEIARIPARTLFVADAPLNPASAPQAAAPVQPTIATPIPAVSPVPGAPTQPQVVVQTTPGYWPWISLALAIGWIITALAWIFQTQPKRTRQIAGTTPNREAAEARKALANALRVGHPSQIREALLDWANYQWPGRASRSLDALAQQLNDPALANEIGHLNKALYSQNPASWDATGLRTALQPHLHGASNPVGDTYDRLPPLYPTR